MGKADKHLTNFESIFVYYHILKILTEQQEELYKHNLNSRCWPSTFEKRFRGVIDLKTELQG